MFLQCSADPDELQQYAAPGRVAQSVTCHAADPGVASSILDRSHTFVETDHEKNF